MPNMYKPSPASPGCTHQLSVAMTTAVPRKVCINVFLTRKRPAPYLAGDDSVGPLIPSATERFPHSRPRSSGHEGRRRRRRAGRGGAWHSSHARSPGYYGNEARCEALMAPFVMITPRFCLPVALKLKGFHVVGMAAVCVVRKGAERVATAWACGSWK